MIKTYGKLELPLLDAQLFLFGTPSERRDFAIKFRDSLYEHGFARVINHGIDESLVNELFDWVQTPWNLKSLLNTEANKLKSRKFFELPQDVKRQIEHLPGPNPQRGWSAVGSESTAKLFGVLSS